MSVKSTRHIDQVLRFHAGTNRLGGDVIWQGVTYVRYPVRATGFEWKARGALPHPRLAVANVIDIVSAMCHQYSDLVGCPVTRKRTLARYLDAANFANGNPFANPADHFNDDLFAVNQKVRESLDIVGFELAAPIDVEGVLLPRRQVVCNACPWRDRGDRLRLRRTARRRYQRQPDTRRDGRRERQAPEVLQAALWQRQAAVRRFPRRRTVSLTTYAASTGMGRLRKIRISA